MIRSKALTCILFIACTAGLLAGCATPRVGDAPRERASAVAVQLSTVGSIAVLSAEDPDEVLFVRLTGDGVLGDDIVRSNFTAGDRYYLLNADVGTYAAIASVKTVPSPFPGGSSGKRTVFFSRELIESTRTVVGPEEFKFMGRFDVQMSAAFSGGDEVQRHYRQIITPGATGEGFLRGMLQAMGGDYTAWGTLRSSAKDDAARAAFFRSAAEDLAGRGWDALLAGPAGPRP